MPIDLAELRRKAEAATKGPWRSQIANGYPWVEGPFDDELGLPRTIVEWNETDENAKADSDFIAAAHPAAILELLDAMQRMRERLPKCEGCGKPDCDWDDWHIPDAEFNAVCPGGNGYFCRPCFDLLAASKADIAAGRVHDHEDVKRELDALDAARGEVRGG